MISVKKGKTQLKGSSRELVGEIFGVLASPDLLKIIMEYKDRTEKIKEASKDLLEIGKVIGADKESCEATKIIEAQLEISDFLIKAVMEAINIGESLKNVNRV